MNTALDGKMEQAISGLDSYKDIDQIIQHLPYNCLFNTRTGFSFRTTSADGTTTHLHAPCGKLTCRYCAHRFYHQAHPALCQAFHDLGLQFYMTLTLPRTVTRDQQDLILKQAIQRLVQDVRRSFKTTLHFFWVIGTHASGSLHAHMLLNTDIRRGSRYGRRIAWLKGTWHRLTGSHQVEVQSIVPGSEPNVVQYLLTNLFETVVRESVRSRRWGSSRSIRLRRRDKRSADSTAKYVRVGKPTGMIARDRGLDPYPVINGKYVVAGKNNDEVGTTSFEPGRAEPPLCRSEATVPAGGGGGSGEPFVDATKMDPGGVDLDNKVDRTERRCDMGR